MLKQYIALCPGYDYMLRFTKPVMVLLVIMVTFCVIYTKPWNNPRILDAGNTIYSGKDSRTEKNTKIPYADFLTNCGSSIRPSRTNKMRNGVWHMESTKSGDVMVYSAFYDDREVYGNGTVLLRIIAVASIKPKDNLLCQLWYKNQPNPFIAKAIGEDTGRGANIEKVFYQERLYTCELPRIPNAEPEFLSLTDQQCKNSSMLVPITYPEKAVVHEIGVCVTALYGTPDPMKIIEWVEMNKLLGVTEISIYDSKVNVETRKVLEYYRNKGMIQLLETGPSVEGWCEWCILLSEISTISDCILRNMYRYKYAAVHDIDELIIPTASKNYKIIDMLKDIRNTTEKEPSTYSFRNTYFFFDIEPNNKTPFNLFTQRYVSRQKPSDPGYSPKVILDPRTCVIMQNHYCMVKAGSRNYKTLNVDPKYGLSHHYKKCHFDKETCENMLKVRYYDASARRYSAELETAFAQALKEMNLKQY